MNLTPLGVFHTILSLVAVVSALAALITHHGIAPRSGVGRVYIWSLVATCLTGLPIFRHGAIGPPHIVGVRTLATFAVAAIAAKTRAFGVHRDRELRGHVAVPRHLHGDRDVDARATERADRREPGGADLQVPLSRLAHSVPDRRDLAGATAAHHRERVARRSVMSTSTPWDGTQIRDDRHDRVALSKA